MLFSLQRLWTVRLQRVTVRALLMNAVAQFNLNLLPVQHSLNYCLRTRLLRGVGRRAAAKSCLLEPRPTSVVLQVHDLLLPVLT